MSIAWFSGIGCIINVVNKRRSSNEKAPTRKLPELSRNSDKELTTLGLIRKRLVTDEGLHVKRQKLLIRLQVHSSIRQRILRYLISVTTYLLDASSIISYTQFSANFLNGKPPFPVYLLLQRVDEYSARASNLCRRVEVFNIDKMQIGIIANFPASSLTSWLLHHLRVILRSFDYLKTLERISVYEIKTRIISNQNTFEFYCLSLPKIFFRSFLGFKSIMLLVIQLISCHARCE